MGKDLKTWWEELRADFTTYLESRTELTKIQVYEKISKVVGVVISFIVLAFLMSFILIFLLIMIGAWVAQLTGSIAIGFSSVAILLIVLFVFLLVKRKTVLEKPVTNRMVDALFDDEVEGAEFAVGNDSPESEDHEK